MSASVEPQHSPRSRARAHKIPAQLHNRCFNCLSFSHHVATCQMPWRCLRCRGITHIAMDCCRSKAASTGVGCPHYSRIDNPPPSPHAPLNSPSTTERSVMGVVEGAKGTRPF